MTAVERVARWLAEIDGCAAPDACLTDAQALIAKFTEQGIPIDKLLSGEMMAVPVEPTEDMLRGAVWKLDGRGEAEAMNDGLAAWSGMIGVCAEDRPHDEMVAIRKRLAAVCNIARANSLGLEPVSPGESIEDWLGRSETRVHRDLKVVKPDYAGNPPVTPERAQEPTGATHSEKPLRGSEIMRDGWD